MYKLAAETDSNGDFVPKIKLSNNPSKVTLPGIKKAIRVYDKQTGKIKADLIALESESYNEDMTLTLFDHNATWKTMTLNPGEYTLRELLVPVFIDGKRVYTSPSTMEIKAYAQKELDTLWENTEDFKTRMKYQLTFQKHFISLEKK